jgi:hypothetical protein
VYVSRTKEGCTTVSKGETSSTDHLPIMVMIKNVKKERTKPKVITKRDMKKFSQQRWVECLTKQEWEAVGNTEDVG